MAENGSTLPRAERQQKYDTMKQRVSRYLVAIEAVLRMRTSDVKRKTAEEMSPNANKPR